MALACETGWGEEYILEMPLARAYTYLHAIYTRHDIACYRLKRTEDEDAFSIFERLRNGDSGIDSGDIA
jgi:hypothetical protein